MAGRWSDPSAFRADPAATPAARPDRRQAVALLAVLLLVAGAVAAASYAIRPERARAFQLFHGSVFLADETAPVGIDLASGKPTLRLLGADKQVGLGRGQTLGVVPLDGRTLLLNQATGEFNMVASSGFVVKHDGGGVPLGGASGPTAAVGVADGQLAYIVRTSSGRTDAYLVSQSTVESAVFATKAVKPRASTTLTDGVADTGPGGAVAAGGSLWLLMDRGTAGERTIRRLTVPNGSSAGAALSVTDHGSVPAPAAIGTGTTAAGTTTVGVASADRIRLWPAVGHSSAVRFAAVAGVDKVLPATSTGDRIAFLLHGRDGWSVVSVGADGSGLIGPRRLAGVPGTDRLAQPAYSNGHLYTLNEDGGGLYRLTFQGQAVPTANLAKYPVAYANGKPAEANYFPDGTVIGRGSRVIFNSPSHTGAVVLFTDGSHRPQRIEKNSAVDVSASGGADQLTRSTVNPNPGPNPEPGKTPPNNGSKKPTGGEVVNNKIDCRNTTQKPHIPRIEQVQTGSRSVTLTWTYPILDRTQDCYPSTYEVGVKLLSANAPSPPSTVRVQSQAGATITGLFPETRYELTVTAYINGQGTASPSIQVQTGPEGPAAPTGLTAAADSSGNWILNWSSCGSVAQGCVAAQSWTVTPSFCDGRGLSAPPQPITTTADPTSRRQPTVRYPGSDALLGRGLQFVVTGAGESQVPGTPSARTPCVYSWSPAVASAMRLSASVPPTTTLGSATSANVTLDLGTDPVRDVGGVGAQVLFQLTGNGKTQTKQVSYDGRVTTLSVNFGGVEAGAGYTASATVRPAHGGSAVTIPSVNVNTRAQWPDVTMSGSCPRSDPLSFTCDLTVQLSGITSAQARGERFDFDGLLSCGAASGKKVSRQNFDPAQPIDAGTVTGVFGTCTLTGTLIENAGAPNPQVFGGQPKSVPAVQVNLGPPPTSGAGQKDFKVDWGNGTSGDAKATIHYTGTQNLARLTTDWSEVILGPDGKTKCGSNNNRPDTSVTASADCIAQFAGSGGQWTVQISYTDTSDGQGQGPFLYGLANPIPGYHYCTPNGFQATWGAKKADGVTVNTGGGDLSGCSGWQYQLMSQPTALPVAHPCGSAGGSPPPANIPIGPTCTDDPTQGTWTVIVSWVDSAKNPQKSDPITVTGPPPTQ